MIPHYRRDLKGTYVPLPGDHKGAKPP